MSMKRRPLIIVGIGLMLFCATGTHSVHGQQPSEDAIVRQYFPQWLINESIEDFNKGGPRPFQAFAYADADLNGTGRSDFIVAAYSNGFSVAVVVLAKRGNSAIEVASPSFPLMGGIEPSVRPLDVDHDGRQEVVVSFSSARGLDADWVLKWDRTTLYAIGPVEVDADGNEDTVLSEAAFIDLDGDGTLDIVASPEFDPMKESSVDTFRVFTLFNGRYVPSRTLNFFETFARPAATEGKREAKDDDSDSEAQRTREADEQKGLEGDEHSERPENTVRTFGVADATVPYMMTIINGDETGTHQIRSAEIELNGIVVAELNVFAQHERTVTIPVTVAASNTLRVELRGRRGSRLTIGIGPQ